MNSADPMAESAESAETAGPQPVPQSEFEGIRALFRHSAIACPAVDAERAGAVVEAWQVRGSDGSIVGAIEACRIGSDGVLTAIAVTESCRGRGVGTGLVDCLLRRLIGSGVRSVALAPAACQDYFRRFGFAPSSREELGPEVAALLPPVGGDPAFAAPMRLDLRSATLVAPARVDDMPAVVAIYNDAVAQSTATYDYEPRALAEQVVLFQQKQLDRHGFYVARALDGTVAGFSTYGLFRQRPGWRFACEHSVYVAAPWRGQRVGLSLLPPIMQHAAARGFHTMVGVVDASNDASIRMHRRAGFEVVGVFREGGYKFDRWLDVTFVQAML